MFGKRKTKTPEERKAVCEICGVDCRDKVLLARHLDWAHKERKASNKD